MLETIKVSSLCKWMVCLSEADSHLAEFLVLGKVFINVSFCYGEGCRQWWIMVWANSHRNPLGQTDVNNGGGFWASDRKSAEAGQASGTVQSEAQLVESWEMFDNRLRGRKEGGGGGRKRRKERRRKRNSSPHFQCLPMIMV